MSEPNESKGWFGRLSSWVRQLTAAARAVWIVAFFLLLATIAVWTLFWLDPTHVPWRHAITWPRIVAVLLLMGAIPPLVYWCLRLWLEGDPSRFPDIDYAFKAGLAALRRHGIDLERAPIYLVLGSSGEELERSFMQAGGLSMRVRGEPEGPAALHWHANPDGVFLFCSEAGWLTALNTLVSKRAPRAPGAGGPRPLPAAILRTANPRQFSGGPAPAPQPQPEPIRAAPPANAPVGGTIMLEQFLSSPSGPAAPAPYAPPQAASGRKGGGTLVFDAPAASEAAPYAAPNEQYEPWSDQSLAAADVPSAVEPQDAVEQLQRLEYVGRLLRRERRPLCPVNGILALLPFSMLEGGLEDAQELQRAVKSDLAAAQRSLQLRCPVTALVVGMEREAGFRELIRRVGHERAAAQRFGRRFETRALATLEQMASLCVHVCGAFEDWIYALFREEGALTRPGNTRLYGLLCKVRCNLQGPLMEVLAGGFGYDPQNTMTDEPTAFSGCYFAATGASPDRQAFVRGVLEKLAEEQEDVEWTRDALASARRTRTLTIILLTFAISLSVAFVSLIVWRVVG